MTKLTEKQKKNIVASYAAGGISQKQLSIKYGVSEETIRQIIKKDTEFLGKIGDIKKDAEEAAAVEWEEFFDKLQPQVQSLMLRLMNLTDEDIQTASLKERAGFLKILAENFIVRSGGDKDIDETPATIEVVVEDASYEGNS